MLSAIMSAMCRSACFKLLSHFAISLLDSRKQPVSALPFVLTLFVRPPAVEGYPSERDMYILHLMRATIALGRAQRTGRLNDREQRLAALARALELVARVPATSVHGTALALTASRGIVESEMPGHLGPLGRWAIEITMARLAEAGDAIRGATPSLEWQKWAIPLLGGNAGPTLSC